MSRRGRRHLETLVHGLEIRDDVIDGATGPVRVRRYENPGVQKRVTLVWAHGGGFVHGDLEMPESHAVAAAVAQSGVRVVAVDYSLVPPRSKKRPFPDGQVPGVRYPVPVNDIVEVFRHASSTTDGSVALGGASAGACLAAAAALRMVRAGETLPNDLVLAYGEFHTELPPVSAEIRSALRGPAGWFAFRPTTVARINRNYAGSESAMREAFPGDHDLAGMPPTLLIDAERDSLRASGSAFASQLQSAGTDVEYHVVLGGIHGFLNINASPQFTQAIDLITRRLATRQKGARQ